MRSLKNLTAYLISLTVLIWGGSVSADIIAQPYRNGFYEVFFDECEFDSDVRRYIVMTECDVMESPLATSTVRTAEAGSAMDIKVYYTDKNGVRWGYDYAYSLPYGSLGFDKPLSGWVKMENLQLKYDHISFVEEHKQELAKYDGQLDGYVPQSSVYLWTYPRSGEAANIIEPYCWFPEEYAFTLKQTAMYTYTDPEGKDWIYLSCVPQGWVYTGDPEKDLREGIPAVTPAETAAQTSLPVTGMAAAAPAAAENVMPVPEPVTLVPESGTKDFILPLVLAAFAAAASGTVIAVTKKTQ